MAAARTSVRKYDEIDEQESIVANNKLRVNQIFNRIVIFVNFSCLV